MYKWHGRSARDMMPLASTNTHAKKLDHPTAQNELQNVLRQPTLRQVTRHYHKWAYFGNRNRYAVFFVLFTFESVLRCGRNFPGLEEHASGIVSSGSEPGRERWICWSHLNDYAKTNIFSSSLPSMYDHWAGDPRDRYGVCRWLTFQNYLAKYRICDILYEFACFQASVRRSYMISFGNGPWLIMGHELVSVVPSFVLLKCIVPCSSNSNKSFVHIATSEVLCLITKHSLSAPAGGILP